MLDPTDLESARRLVYAHMPPTPQYRWPLLEAAVGGPLWVKHENHTPTGAFKVRGGIVYCDALRQAQPEVRGIISATRGNHGQSLARAGRASGLAVTIVVPETNSPEKNAAMRGFGAELVIHGRDFDAARRHAAELAEARRLEMVPSYHPWLVQGVASYALELFEAAGPLDAVYVPIGMGSGISGLIAARDRLGLRTAIVGVVAQGAPAFARSFEAGRVVTSESAQTFADGMACREPDETALAVIRRGADRIVVVDDDAVAEAIRLIFRATHNVAEGAGAAALAARLQENAQMAGRPTAVILCGGNIDTEVITEVLEGRTPPPF